MWFPSINVHVHVTSTILCNVYRYQSTQLVLWPDQRVSFAAVRDSPALQAMVFTGEFSMLYTHTTHRLFPLKTSSQTGAELTEISSMVSGEDREKTSPLSTPVDSQPSSTCNSPHTAKDKGRGRHETPASLRNGLTESLLPPSLPSPSPTPSCPSPFSLPCQDKASLSPMRLSIRKKCTGIVSSYDHVNNIESNYNGEMSNNPCNHENNEYKEEKAKEQSTSSNDGGRDLLCMPTYMPRFLLAYTPPVSAYVYIQYLYTIHDTFMNWVVC